MPQAQALPRTATIMNSNAHLIGVNSFGTDLYVFRSSRRRVKRRLENGKIYQAYTCFLFFFRDVH